MAAAGCGRMGNFRMTKAAGAKNPADILTKYKGLRDFQDQLTRVNVQKVARGHDQGGGASGDKDDTLTVGGRAAGKSWSLGQMDDDDLAVSLTTAA